MNLRLDCIFRASSHAIPTQWQTDEHVALALQQQERPSHSHSRGRAPVFDVVSFRVLMSCDTAGPTVFLNFSFMFS